MAIRASTVGTLARSFDRERLTKIADILVGATLVSLPWSTSASGLFVVLWLLAVLPTLDLASLRRVIATPAGGLPVALWMLAAFGVLWADTTWSDRVAGFASYHKLLLIPLLFVQFARSKRGPFLLAIYLVSVAVLVAVSWALMLIPGLQGAIAPDKILGLPVRDSITQSGEFVAVAFVLLYLAIDFARSGRRAAALACATIAVAALANMVFVVTGRTALVVAVLLALMLGLRWAGWKGVVAALVAGGLVASLAWTASPYLRGRVAAIEGDLRSFERGEIVTSSGERLTFWIRSLGLIEQAPVVGHGTTTPKELFRRSAVGTIGIEGSVTANPHNQVLAVAIQLGALGTALLLAMWAAHLMMFRGSGVIAWAGLLVVTQNIVSSMFNSHLFDFTQGWTYVFAVGILGGTTMREALHAPPSTTVRP